MEIEDTFVPAEINVDKESITVDVTIKNIGKYAGSEVIQTYVHEVNSKFDRPEKELKGFCKVFLQPGEKKTVTISISKEELSGYYMEFGEWITKPGEYEIMVGTSSRDIKRSHRIAVKCKDPFGLSGRTSIGALVKDEKAVEIVNRIMEADIYLLAHVALEFAPDKSFCELWNGTNIQGALKAKGWNDETIAAKYQQIMDEFDKQL